MKGFIERHADDHGVAFEDGAIFGGCDATRWVNDDVKIKVPLTNYAWCGKRRRAEGFEFFWLNLEPEFFGEFTRCATLQTFGTSFVCLDQPCGEFPEAAEVFAFGDGPNFFGTQSNGWAQCRAQVDHASTLIIDVVSGDDDGIEAFTRDDVVGERFAWGLVFEARAEDGSFDVEKRLRRRFFGAANGFSNEHDSWQRGQRHRRDAEHTLDRGGQVKFAEKVIVARTIVEEWGRWVVTRHVVTHVGQANRLQFKRMMLWFFSTHQFTVELVTSR